MFRSSKRLTTLAAAAALPLSMVDYKKRLGAAKTGTQLVDLLREQKSGWLYGAFKVTGTEYHLMSSDVISTHVQSRPSFSPTRQLHSPNEFIKCVSAVGRDIETDSVDDNDHDTDAGLGETPPAPLDAEVWRYHLLTRITHRGAPGVARYDSAFACQQGLDIWTAVFCEPTPPVADECEEDDYERPPIHYDVEYEKSLWR